MATTSKAFEPKALKNRMDGNVFGPHRRERIAFLVEFGKAKHGHGKAGPGRSKASHFNKKTLKSVVKCYVLLRPGPALPCPCLALPSFTRKAIRSRLCCPNTLLPIPFFGVFRHNALLCLAKALLCCARALLCRAWALLCLAQALLCLAQALLCFAQALLYFAQALLCRAEALLCDAQALLCLEPEVVVIHLEAT